MTIKAYIPPTKIKDVIPALQELPVTIRPSYYSEDEIIDLKGRKAILKNVIADRQKFEAFIANNQLGFFLISERVNYSVDLNTRRGFPGLFVEDQGNGLSEEEAKEILKVVAKVGAVFAFAAAWDEYLHRNRYIRVFGENQYEGWVGRDIRKYLPGIYWLTLLSKEHADAIAGIDNTLGATIAQVGAEHLLVRAFDYPSEWQNHAVRIDEWLAQQPMFFSKRRILPQLDAAPNIMALSESTAEWR